MQYTSLLKDEERESERKLLCHHRCNIPWGSKITAYNLHHYSNKTRNLFFRFSHQKRIKNTIDRWINQDWRRKISIKRLSCNYRCYETTSEVIGSLRNIWQQSVSTVLHFLLLFFHFSYQSTAMIHIQWHFFPLICFQMH